VEGGLNEGALALVVALDIDAGGGVGELAQVLVEDLGEVVGLVLDEDVLAEAAARGLQDEEVVAAGARAGEGLERGGRAGDGGHRPRSTMSQKRPHRTWALMRSSMKCLARSPIEDSSGGGVAAMARMVATAPSTSPWRMCQPARVSLRMSEAWQGSG